MLFWIIYIPGLLVSVVIAAMIVERAYGTPIHDWEGMDWFLNAIMVLMLAFFWPLTIPLGLACLLMKFVFLGSHWLRNYLDDKYPWMRLG